MDGLIRVDDVLVWKTDKSRMFLVKSIVEELEVKKYTFLDMEGKGSLSFLGDDLSVLNRYELHGCMIDGEIIELPGEEELEMDLTVTEQSYAHALKDMHNYYKTVDVDTEGAANKLQALVTADEILRQATIDEFLLRRDFGGLKQYLTVYSVEKSVD